jgi:ACT domain-containing protein
MKAVITVIGKDMVGILAKVSGVCADVNANIIEVTQSVLQDYFAMVMLVDMEKMTTDVAGLETRLTSDVDSMKIHVMHEDIFNSMHRI